MLKSMKLVGISMKMSLADNKTAELWQRFMPVCSEVKNRVNTDFISMQIYGEDWTFSPDAQFEKWAAVEVSTFSEIPANMETYMLQGGKYAVFIHKGPAGNAAQIMQWIFGKWLPDSEYLLDNREHFEILPENYRPQDTEATEEIWIPVKDKVMIKESRLFDSCSI